MMNANLNPADVEHFRPLSQLIPANWQTGTVSTADNTSIHYTRTGGDKPPLVLLHGVQVSGLSWLRTAQALENFYDVILPDFRGHGQSSRLSDRGTSAEIMVNDITDLIKTLELKSPLVIGHSMGADIAGRLAAIHPLRAVVLVDPPLQNFAAASLMDSDEPPEWMQTILDTLRSLKALSHKERMIAGLTLMPPGRPITNEMDYVSFIDGQAQFDSSFYRYMSQLGYLFEDTTTISQIKCPMLLLTACPMMPGMNIETGIAAFTESWQDGQHIHFEDSGHAIMFDQFDRFIEVGSAFFDKIRT